MIKVNGYDHLKKDPTNGAILLDDEHMKNDYFKRKSEARKLRSIDNDINAMKTDIQEIKELLAKLINA